MARYMRDLVSYIFSLDIFAWLKLTIGDNLHIGSKQPKEARFAQLAPDR